MLRIFTILALLSAHVTTNAAEPLLNRASIAKLVAQHFGPNE
jgi:hypothetical protein